MKMEMSYLTWCSKSTSRGNIIKMNTHIKKLERSQVKTKNRTESFTSQGTRKGEQLNPKVKKRKKANNKDQRGNKCNWDQNQVEHNNKAKSWFLKM